jgi:hypothetical protein
MAIAAVHHRGYAMAIEVSSLPLILAMHIPGRNGRRASVMTIASLIHSAGAMPINHLAH